MLDLVVGLVVALLVLAGVLIIVGPWLPRRVRALRALQSSLRRRLPAPAPPPAARPAVSALHPGTQRVLLATSRLVALLRAGGEDELAEDFRSAGRRLASDETAGLYSLQALFRRLRETSLREPKTQNRLRQLAVELRQAVADRAEQLELLPFG